jgi:hypothetical protein
MYKADGVQLVTKWNAGHARSIVQKKKCAKRARKQKEEELNAMNASESALLNKKCISGRKW